MAEISCGGHVESAALEGDWRPWCDDCHYAVRARLAEVKAERDALRAALFGAHQDQETAEALRARLAEVEALCDRAAAIDARCEWMPLVRAAARAEGDR